MSDAYQHDVREDRDIAIVGMSGRFPGARDLQQFWENLRQGRESVTFFSDEELRAAGVSDDELRDPHYIKAGIQLEDVECFDAGFFGYTPHEAELLDPQQRVFLECCWHALEHAGYVPEQFDGAIGVYAGVAWNTYLLSNLTAHPELFDSQQVFQTFITNDKDFMATRVSYKLNLKGPSVIVQTSCSTSLVAVHLACLGLQDYDCDIALVGGVTIKVPQVAGYAYQLDGLSSPDGHCRAFDAQAQGTIFGSGVGVVALKRLQDALDDGDTIHAVIRGTAINNDGSLKVSYTAPSVEGQGAVIAAALAVAEVEADTIGYIEAHGTATAFGDPIEVAALTRVFRSATQKTNFCGIGSVKTNIGHLDAAAGIAGLIKTTLALTHREIPPSLHFTQPNPKIDFASSPFYVNADLRDWPQLDAPRRAGVSSFGVGGTNAHVILEEAPELPATAPAAPWQVLPLSAKTPAALDAATANLAAYLRQHEAVNLADVAYTLQQGRRALPHRRVLVARDAADAGALLAGADPERVFSGSADERNPSVAFLFPGQGAQTVGMGREIYAQEPVFRATVDRCCAVLEAHLGLDLRTVLYPAPDQTAAAAAQLQQTALAQPALFVVEYALAQLWQHWGVTPAALLGHSLGELVAATLAGVFTLEDALPLVAERGRLMQTCAPGALLSVALPAADLDALLGPDLSLAALNTPTQTVVAGSEAAIERLRVQLERQGSRCRRLPSAHAFHSPAMEPILPAFRAAVARVARHAPQRPFLSNVTGAWITAAEATDPDYWTQQLRQPVRFAAGLQALAARGAHVALEVGPGTTLSTFARQQPGATTVLSSLRHPQDQRPERAVLLSALGQLWLHGVAPAWTALHSEPRRRIPLPTYPFERQRFWIESQPRARANALPAASVTKRPNLADWFYLPTWKRTLAPAPARAEQAIEPGCWLFFADESGIAASLSERVRRNGQTALLINSGAGFAAHDDHSYTIDPRRPEDYRALLAALAERSLTPTNIAHLWTFTAAGGYETDFDTLQDRGFFSLLYLVQALTQQFSGAQVRLDVISSHMQRIAGEPTLHPAKATLLGLCQVVPQEYPSLSCHSIDLLPAERGPALTRLQLDQLLAELRGPTDPVVAYRDGQRWVQSIEPARLQPLDPPLRQIRQRGVYLISGGLSGAGFALAAELARTAQARLVIVEGAPLPPSTQWTELLSSDTLPEETRRQIRRARALEAHGAELIIHHADLADRAQLTAIVAQTVRQFDVLHGVIHAPGAADVQMFRAVQELDRTACDWHLGPKARGLLALDAALDNITLDFRLIVSSLTSILGGRGYTAYAAANLFMDAFAQQQARLQPGRWLCINMDAWELADEQEQITALNSDLAQLAMRADEGAEVARLVIAASTAEQIIVSTADLQARIEQGQSNIAARWAQLQQGEQAGPAQLHPRPQLQTAYVAPDSELEQSLVRIWQRVLGFEQVGIYDNFFELGGDSFIAIQVIAQVKKDLDIELPAVKLYQGLTIKALAELLSQDMEQVAQRRSAQLEDRRQQMSARKQYQQMRRTR